MQATPEVQRAAQQFAEAAIPRLTAITQFLSTAENPDTLGHFLEETISGLIQQRLGPKSLISGVLYRPGGNSDFRIIDSIVYDPGKGKIDLHNGRLHIVNPQVAAGVIQIKAFVSNLPKFSGRLATIRDMLFDRPRSATMGVIVRDPQPHRSSSLRRSNHRCYAWDASVPKSCPVYILFSYHQGVYQPYTPAIEAFLSNLHKTFHPQF